MKRRSKDPDRPPSDFRDVVEVVGREVEESLAPAAASRLAARLIAADESRRSLWLRNSRVAPRVEIVQSLIERSRDTRHSDAAECLSAARAAVQTAESLAADRRVAAEWQARAWLSMANAQRIAERLPKAAEALGKAELAIRSAATDPVLLGHLLTARASYLRHRRRFDAALEASRESVSVYESCGRPERVLHAKAFQAGLLAVAGHHAEAVTVGTQALERLGDRGDPILVISASHNIGCALLSLGQLEAGLQVLRSLRRPQEVYGMNRLAFKSRGLEGVALARLGRWPEAVEVLSPALSAARRFGWQEFIDECAPALRRSLACSKRSGDGPRTVPRL